MDSEETDSFRRKRVLISLERASHRQTKAEFGQKTTLEKTKSGIIIGFGPEAIAAQYEIWNDRVELREQAATSAHHLLVDYVDRAFSLNAYEIGLE